MNTILITTLGGAGGVLFYALNLPAPFMLGAMVTCWVVGGVMHPLRPYMNFPWGIRFTFVTAVAVVLGSYATPEAITGMISWWPSLFVLGLISLAMAWGSYFYLGKIRGYDDLVAWFSAQPAGLTEVVTMAGIYTDKDYLVAFFHLVRVSTVFLFAPMLVWLVASDFDAQAVPVGQLHFWQVTLWHWPMYLAVAVAGFFGAKLLRIPMAMLLGPMLLSAIISGSGVVTFDRPFEVIALIQVALGASIGARMGQVNFGKLWRAVPDAYINAFGMIVLAMLGAWVLHLWQGEPMLKYFLAISPGGVSELSLISVALGYEVAFITLHHLFRMAAVLFAMPIKKLPKL